MADLDGLHAELRAAAPELVGAIFDCIAPALIGTLTLEQSTKAINDPIWKLITLSSLQTALIDTALMQRLRRVRQLGLAHLVYPGAQHSRLEHSIGAMRAATIMFEQLRPETPHARENIIRELVALAGLLHDCGHLAFSHVGERVLADLFHEEFTACRDVLYRNFEDPIAPGPASAKKVGRKAVPAAELLSALLVTSPSMIEALGEHGITQSHIKLICGLIIGRPTEQLRDAGNYHHYIKTIVSGDVDCDKLDYVARDAYYAGLPVSADVDRLVSQITTAKLDQHTTIEGTQVPTGAPHPDAYYLMAIRPAGTSALEMFVMTRSYLFDRIYTHHKVRAAERSLERLLRQFLQFQTQLRQRDIKWCLQFMLSRGGDDALLGQLADWADQDEDSAKHFRQRASDILDRKIPKRAYAVSLRTLADYKPGVGRPDTAISLPWSYAYDDLSQNPMTMEDDIAALAGIEADDIYFDWLASNPVKENPDIWVKDSSLAESLLRVNQFFDVEQLSNAYRDVKMTAWVFVEGNRRDEVAAATAYALHRKYDVVTGSEARRRAKITYNGFSKALRDLEGRAGSSATPLVDNLLKANGDLLIRAPKSMYEPALTQFDAADRDLIAEKLSRSINDCKLPRRRYDDLNAAIIVLNYLLRHCKVYNRNELFRQSVARTNEKRFQKHVIEFLNAQPDFAAVYDVSEKTSASGGETDLIISRKGGGPEFRPVIVELKSAEEGWETLYTKHAGQSQQYSEAGYGRVSFLYCQYKSANATRIEDTIQVRRSGEPDSPQATICLAQRAFADVPSDGGKTTIAVS